MEGTAGDASVSAAKIRNGDPKDQTLKAFRLFNGDEARKVSIMDLNHVAEELGERMKEVEIWEVTNEADRDGNVSTSEEQFGQIVRKIDPDREQNPRGGRAEGKTESQVNAEMAAWLAQAREMMDETDNRRRPRGRCMTASAVATVRRMRRTKRTFRWT